VFRGTKDYSAKSVQEMLGIGKGQLQQQRPAPGTQQLPSNPPVNRFENTYQDNCKEKKFVPFSCFTTSHKSTDRNSFVFANLIVRGQSLLPLKLKKCIKT